MQTADPMYREVTIPVICTVTCHACQGWGDIADPSDLPGTPKPKCRICQGTGEVRAVRRRPVEEVPLYV